MLDPGDPPSDMNPLKQFLDTRDGLQEVRPAGPWRTSGETVAGLLTAALDGALAALLAGAGAGHSVALVALGGYGRGQLCLASDVDLLIVYDGSVPATLAQEILYPLWDAKLSVGHAVRNEREVVREARESVESLTSMLTGRFIAGDKGLWHAARAALERVVKKDASRLISALVADETAIRRSQPYHVLDPDIKTGRGGLRTVHRRQWIRRITGEDDRMSTKAAHAESVLLATRNGIHAWAGRADDRLHTDAAKGAARWLGVSVAELEREVLTAVRAVEVEFDTEAEALGRGGFGRSRRRRRKPWNEGALAPVQDALDQRHPLTPIHLAALEPSSQWNESDRATLLSWAQGGALGRQIAAQLWDFGWLEREIPELARTVGLGEPAPFHTHPVDAHLWRTVDELLLLTGPESTEPWCADLASDLGSLDELVIACLFHDIGKGTGEDHSIAGARMARGFLDRVGWAPAGADIIGRAVELHLLLPRVATQRDLRDVAVIDEVAAQVGDPQLLRALALLTVADSRATGPSTWSPWKASLVRTLTNKAMSALTGNEEEPSELDEVVAALAGRHTPGQIAAHAQTMGAGYLSRFDPDEIDRHIEILTPPPREHEQRIDVIDLGEITRCVVAATDQRGFLVAVAGVLAMHGIEVLDARLGASSAGVVVDTFHVEDGRQGGPVPPGQWSKVGRSLREVLAGARDLETELATRRRTYRHRYGTAVQPRVLSSTSGSMPSIEVIASDRIGLLHDIAKVIFDGGHDIALAKIDTRGGIATDVFYLDELADDDRLTATVSELTKTLRTPTSP